MAARTDDLNAREPVHRIGSYRAWGAGARGELVDLIWHCRVGHARPETHRLLPFTEPSLVLRRRFDQQDRTLDCELVICPAQLDGGIYSPTPGEEQFAVRLAPEQVEEALGLRAAELRFEEVELPRRFNAAFDDALIAGEYGRRDAALAALLRGIQAIARSSSQDRVSYAKQILRESSGRIDVRRIAERAEVSLRHLRREFASRYGMAPRAIARRLRLTSAITEAELYARPDWAGIAAGHGFSDQSHLIRECGALLGQSPRSLHKDRLAMAVSFNTCP